MPFLCNFGSVQNLEFQPRDEAGGGQVSEVRRPPRSRVQRRPAPHRAQVLHQRHSHRVRKVIKIHIHEGFSVIVHRGRQPITVSGSTLNETGEPLVLNKDLPSFTLGKSFLYAEKENSPIFAELWWESP